MGESVQQHTKAWKMPCIQEPSSMQACHLAMPHHLPLQREIRLVLERGGCWQDKHGVRLGDGDFQGLAGVLATVWAVDLAADDRGAVAVEAVRDVAVGPAFHEGALGTCKPRGTVGMRHGYGMEGWVGSMCWLFKKGSACRMESLASIRHNNILAAMWLNSMEATIR